MQPEPLILLGTATFPGNVHEDLYMRGNDLFIVVRRPGVPATSLIRIKPSDHDRILSHF